jgi:tRNA(adenine34) deaminase
MADDALARDDHFMELALHHAALAGDGGDVPVGAIVVHDGVVVGVGENRRTRDQDPLHHAEILALRDAAAALGRWRLDDCTLYVTLEPCAMCAGAIVHARIKRLVFGCHEPKSGAVRSLYQVCDDPRAHHRAVVTSGVQAAPCAALLTAFFKTRRSKPAT